MHFRLAFLDLDGLDQMEKNSIKYPLDVIKEYDQSTIELDPVVLCQRDGLKPDQVAKTPVPKTPTTPRTPYRRNAPASKHMISLRSQGFTEATSLPDPSQYGYDDDESFGNSLQRRIAETPRNMASGFHPHLASQFYKDFSAKDFSVWLYHGVVGTPYS